MGLKQDLNCTYTVFGRRTERLAIPFAPHTAHRKTLFILQYRGEKKPY